MVGGGWWGEKSNFVQSAPLLLLLVAAAAASVPTPSSLPPCPVRWRQTKMNSHKQKSRYLCKSLLDQPSEKRFFTYACREGDGRSEEEDEGDRGFGPED